MDLTSDWVCETYKCKMSVRGCVVRQVAKSAHAPVTPQQFDTCLTCRRGQELLKKVGKKQVDMVRSAVKSNNAKRVANAKKGGHKCWSLRVSKR